MFQVGIQAIPEVAAQVHQTRIGEHVAELFTLQMHDSLWLLFITLPTRQLPSIRVAKFREITPMQRVRKYRVLLQKIGGNTSFFQFYKKMWNFKFPIRFY